MPQYVVDSPDRIVKFNMPCPQLDLDDFKVDNAYFRSFDIVVRRQLDPVWHKVGPKTKQLVNDLGTLRRLLWFVSSPLLEIIC